MTFFLPFFPKGCNDKFYEETKAQSVADPLKITDSLRLDSANKKANHESVSLAVIHNDTFIDTIQQTINSGIDSLGVEFSAKYDTTVEKDDKFDISGRLAKESNILSVLLRPKGEYTGIGYIINSIIPMILYGGVTIALFLWIIGLLLKWHRKNIFHVINLTGLILFYFTGFTLTFTPIDSKLWGFWASFTIGVLMVIYDLYLFCRIKLKPGLNKVKGQNII